MLGPADRAALMTSGRPHRYRAGVTLVGHGDRGDSVFVIRAGWVKLRLATEDGHEIVLALLGPGERFGEFEAIDRDSDRRDADVVALDVVDCRVLTVEEFEDFIGSRPQAGLFLLRAIIRRLRAADRRRRESGSLDVGHRLARFLLELAEGHGRARPGGIDIDLAMTQQELASVISASR
jgi:CRP-like cAMP-binding protein